MKTSNSLGERKSPRREYRRSVGLLCHGKYQVSDCVEISEGGMTALCRSKGMIAAGDEIVVTVFLTTWISVKAKVITVLDSQSYERLGIQLTGITSAQRRTIRAYVNAA